MKKVFAAATFLALAFPILISAASCPSLARGSTGPAVISLQQFLFSQYTNFPTPTGYFGPTTETAVKQWQKEHGIVSSGSPATTGWGSVGPKTAAMMKLSCSSAPATTASSTISAPAITRTLSKGMSSTDVTALQQKLIALGYLAAGNASGYFGALTEAAVQKFQAKQGIVSSGTPQTTGYGSAGTKTLAAIVSVGGESSNFYPPSPITSTPIVTTYSQSTTSAATSTQNLNSNSNTNSNTSTQTQQQQTNQTNLAPTNTPSTISSATGDTFAIAPASGATPLAVTFTGTINASSSCAASAYTFSFGDGMAHQIDVLANTCAPQQFSFTHTFVKSGTFSIGLYKNSLRSLLDNTAKPVPVGTSASINVSQGTTIPTPNPEYDIDPKTVFPSKAALLPDGITYADTVPDTLDLAERAGWYISGATKTINPTMYDAPTGAILSAAHLSGAGYCNEQPGPCLISGTADWGKVMLAIAVAREMSGFDRDDSQGTLSTQYAMMENMLSYDVNTALGVPIVNPSSAITPSTIAMEALAKEWQEHPTAALKNAIDQFALMHYDNLISVKDPQGNSYSTIWNTPDSSLDSFGTYVGSYGSDMFINGKALRVLEEWYLASGSSLAYQIGQSLSNFVRNYNNNIFWVTPDPSKYPQSPGMFAGHTHSYLMSVLGMLDEAQARLQTNSNDALAAAEISFANSVYGFMKRQFQPGLVGNFGEMGTAGDMARVGIKLSELGAGDYYDEVEGWTRNQLAEGQIDDSVLPYIPDNSTGTYDTSHIGSKVKGMFFSDATHVFAIPNNSVGTAMFNNDGPANAMRGLYEVWNHIVDINGSVAQVNFLLNRPSQYFDIKSDLPYRGRVEIDATQNLGPVTSLQVHIPSWTDKSQVKVLMRGQGGVDTAISNWTWSGAYVVIPAIAPNSIYTVTFPIKVYTAPVYETRDANHFWMEGSFLITPATDPGVMHTGTFRGSTLVDATNRPSAGIPRYQRAALAALAPTDVEPPMKTVTQFVFNGTSSSIPSIPSAQPTCSMSFSPATVQPGQPSTFSWSSTNASSVTTSTWGRLGTSGTFPNAKSGQTFTVQGTAAGANSTGTCTATLTVSASAPPAPSCTETISPTTVALGQTFTDTWTSMNATAMTLVATRGGTPDIGPGPTGLNGSYQSSWATPGTYLYTRNVTDANGATGSCSASLTVQ